MRRSSSVGSSRPRIAAFNISWNASRSPGATTLSMSAKTAVALDEDDVLVLLARSVMGSLLAKPHLIIAAYNSAF
jgi:hypothetical protein